MFASCRLVSRAGVLMVAAVLLLSSGEVAAMNGQCQTAVSGGHTWNLCKGNEGCCPSGTKCYAFSDQVSVCSPYCPVSWQCSRGHTCPTHGEWMLCKGNEGCCPKNTKCSAYTDEHFMCTAECPADSWLCVLDKYFKF